MKGTRMSKILKRLKSVVSLLGEFWVFMRMQKKWWLATLVVILILMGILIILTEGSALAPFIYAIF